MQMQQILYRRNVKTVTNLHKRTQRLHKEKGVSLITTFQICLGLAFRITCNQRIIEFALILLNKYNCVASIPVEICRYSLKIKDIA